MVKADGTDRVVLSQVIFIGSIVSMPCNDIEGAVFVFDSKEFSLEFIDNRPFLDLILVPGHWGLKVSRVCQAI